FVHFGAATHPTTTDSRKPRLPGLSYPSGRRDLNSGPLVPQTSALTRLRHAPRRATRYQAVSGAAPPRSATQPLFIWPRFASMDNRASLAASGSVGAQAKRGAARACERPRRRTRIGLHLFTSRRDGAVLVCVLRVLVASGSRGEGLVGARLVGDVVGCLCCLVGERVVEDVECTVAGGLQREAVAGA